MLKERVVLIFLFLLIFGLRLYHIEVAPLEIEESWRQADTESIARNFAQYDFNPLRPNLNYDGPFPNIPALEIQVTTYVIAILYKLFGQHYFLARLVPIFFFMVSCLFLYLFARRYLTPRGAVLAILIYGVLPINVYYSRAIMPEAAALMFMTGGVYFFDVWAGGSRSWFGEYRSWFEERRLGLLIVGILFFSLGLMTKPPVIFAAIPMLYLCFSRFGFKWLRFPELWLYAALTLGLSCGYYFYSARIAEFKFTVGIARNIIFPKAFSAFLDPQVWQFFQSGIPKTFGIIGITLALAGLAAVRRKQAVILVWFAAMLAEVLLIVAPVRALYYLIFFTVPCALLAGNLLDRIFSTFAGRALVLLLILALCLESYVQVKPMFTVNEAMAVQTKVVREVSDYDDLLVVGSFDPCILSLADRRGWRFNLGLNPDVPKDPYQELETYIKSGAKYFVPIQGNIYGDVDGRLSRYIESKYSKIEIEKGYPVYVLK